MQICNYISDRSAARQYPAALLGGFGCGIAIRLPRSGERTAARHGQRIASPVAAGAATAFRPTRETGAKTIDRPLNVVWMVADHQAHAHHWPLVWSTPLKRRLAREGCNFTSARTVLPICSPARASMLTGLYPHAHGVTENDGRFGGRAGLDPGGRLVHRPFREAGYRCGAGSGSGMSTIADPPRTTASRGSPCRVTDIPTRRPSIGATSRTRTCRRPPRESRCPESPASRSGRGSS